MSLAISNAEIKRAGSDTSVRLDGNRDGKVTVQEVIVALKAVGIEFGKLGGRVDKAKYALSERVVAQFGGKNKDYSLEEFTELVNKNPQVLMRNNLKIITGNKSFVVDNDGKLKEEPTVVPVKTGISSALAKPAESATVVVPSVAPKSETVVVPFNSMYGQVEKHLERFKTLTGITNDDLAKDCLKDILSDKEASIDTINGVFEKKLKIGLRFNSFSFNAFGVNNKTKAKLSGDAFLSNLEATILDLNGAGKSAPSTLKEYAEGINFSFISPDSNFGKANVSVFRESARTLLNKYSIKDANNKPIDENTEISDLIRALLKSNPESITESDKAKLDYLKKTAGEAASKLQDQKLLVLKAEDSKGVSDIEITGEKSKVSEALGEQISTDIANKLYAKMPELITWTEGLVGMNPQTMFSGLYENANNREPIYKERLQEFFDKSGNVFDMKGLRPGLWYMWENMTAGSPKAMINNGEQGGTIVPRLADNKVQGEIK